MVAGEGGGRKKRRRRDGEDGSGSQRKQLRNSPAAAGLAVGAFVGWRDKGGASLAVLDGSHKGKCLMHQVKGL